MGSVRIDIHKADHRLSERYRLSTVKGVTSLLSSIHYLRAKRDSGDIDVCILLVDFEKALKSVDLSDREREAIYYRFECDMNAVDVGTLMGISKGGVLKHIRSSAYKIAKTFRGTDGYI